MPCAVKSSFRTCLQISLERSIIHTPILVHLLTENGFHVSNRKSLLSDFEIQVWHVTIRIEHVHGFFGMIRNWFLEGFLH